MSQPQDPIHTYTREEAIKNGCQVCVSEQFPDDTDMFEYPIYFTAEVWEICQEKGAIVSDICTAAREIAKKT